MDPFPYTAGVIASSISGRDRDMDLIAIAGENCREIYSVAVTYAYDIGQPQLKADELTYPLSEVNFLWLLEEEDVREQLGTPYEVRPRGVRFLDKDGNDITEEFRDDSGQQNWSGGRSSAEQFLLYVYIGIVAVLGLVFIRYFLRRD